MSASPIDPDSNGRVPKGWSKKILEEFATLQRGKDLTKAQFRDGTFPVAGSNGIIGYHDTALVTGPGITVGRSGSTGKVTLYDVDFWPHNTTLYVKNFHGNDPYFTKYFLDYLDLSRFKTGASVPTLDRNSFKSLPVAVPNPDEQKKIAQVLSTVQRTIEAQERIIQTTTELKKALMHKLFTEGLHNEPQKQTEIGPVPESWDVVALGDFLEMAQYGMSVKGNANGNYPILRMTNQVNGRIVPRDLQYAEISDTEFRRFRLERGDILFNRTNSFELVGRTAIFDLPGDFVFASYLIRLRTDKSKLYPQFLNCYFNAEQTQARLKSIATRAVSQSNISATRLKGFLVPVPRLELQSQFVLLSNALDKKVASADAKRQKFRALFETLLHQMMTGRVRVTN